MSKDERPLPKPPNTPFGRKKNFEHSEGKVPLMSDQMAMAMAEGRLEDFLQQELPDNEYARSLAMMMMGMTGMSLPTPEKKSDEQPGVTGEKTSSQKMPSGVQPPEDIINAVQAGDVKGLMKLLEREHKKRMNNSEPSVRSEDPVQYSAQPNIEKEILDQLIKIASDNAVTLDWIVLRALKLYVQEHLKTGRL